MSAPHETPVTRRPQLLASLVEVAVALTLTLGGACPAAAAANHIGKWTPAQNVDDVAVHLALMPSPSPGSYHSKIVFWNHGHRFGNPDAFAGKVWNWSPTVQDACGSWPSSNFSAQTLDPPEFDVFCAVS